MRGLVIADDATGALECGSLLAGLGVDVSVVLDAGPAPVRECVVADTESRHLPPEEARGRVKAWADRAGESWIYKKTDSALRGNIAAELSAFEGHEAVYVGAYPALGRTVRGGRLFVHGVPVEETEFARDARHPVKSGDLRALLGEGVDVRDAETEEDLARIAQSLAGRRRVIAGPSGFVPYWARLAGLTPGETRRPPAASRWLIICGSLHPASLRQAGRAEAAGLTVLRTPHERLGAEQASADLARRTVQRLAEADSVFIMGGDTAIAIWRAMRIRELTPYPQALPGVAVSSANGILFVTKAGGFGADDVVERVKEKLSGP
jgi:uncharacterized protein YgbK (DUF1537 family)